MKNKRIVSKLISPTQQILPSLLLIGKLRTAKTEKLVYTGFNSSLVNCELIFHNYLLLFTQLSFIIYS